MKLRYYLLTAVYCAGLFCLSAQSFPPAERALFPGADKLAHAVLYAGLAAVVAVGMWRAPNRSPRRTSLLCVPFLFAAAYGLFEEVHQYFVPSRTFDWADVAANAAGALAAQAVFAIWQMRRPPAEE